MIDPRDAVIAELQATIERQQAIIERLEARVAELERRLGQNSSNSSQPPSSDTPQDRSARRKDQPSGRPRGGQVGHKGHRRVLLPPERVTSTHDEFPASCRRCGEALPRERDLEAIRHQVIDLPEIQPEVAEWRLHRVTCACGVTTCAELPTGVPAGIMGPSLLALVALLVGDFHISRRKVRTLLADLLSIDLSLGALSESEELVSDAVAVAVDNARLHALAARVKHVDATTWYQAGAYRSLWTLATAAVTVFTIATDGTRAALRSWLDRVRGVLVSDRGSQFTFWAMHRRQICWAHLIRKFASFADRGGRIGEVGDNLLVWSRVLMHQWHHVRDGTLSRAQFQRGTCNLRAVIERLLEAGARLPARGVGGAFRNILDHREALWTFIDERDVDPTNNHAERELRAFVLWRRGCFGSQSERGDRFAAHIKSVVHTCRKQRRGVLAFLTAAVHADLHGRLTPSLLPQ